MNSKFLKLAYTMTVALLLAACSQDEVTEQGTILSEGKYPLKIASVAMSGECSEQLWGADAPQTRVAENTTDGNSSHWTNDDPIAVQIGTDNTNTGKYKVKVDGSGNVTGLEAETPLYWKNTSSQKVKGWYPADTGSDIPLNNQSRDGLAYVLYAETASEVNYQTTNIQLPFNHLLSKIRVKPTGTKADDVNAIAVFTYPACKFSPNDATKVAGSGTAGYIPMKKVTYDNGSTYCWEANVVPGYEIEKFRINNAIEGTLATVVMPQAAKVHEVSITVKQAFLKPVDGKFTINTGNVIIKDYTGTEPIVVNGNATITIENVKLSTTTDNVMTINNGATVTLNVEGMNNELTSTGGAGIKIMETTNPVQRGSIIVTGKGASSSGLKITAKNGAAIGFRMVGEQFLNKTIYCGNIEINNITLEAKGGDGSPAIGISALEYDKYDCPKTYGNISINTSIVSASSTGGAACIGTPAHNSSSPFSLGTISINNSTVTATADGAQAACIGFGGTFNGASAFKRVIKKIEFNKATLNLTTGATNKVGFGDGDTSRELTDGIWEDGVKVGDTGWNP